jgi:hypothetical protein
MTNYLPLCLALRTYLRPRAEPFFPKFRKFLGIWTNISSIGMEIGLPLGLPPSFSPGPDPSFFENEPHNLPHFFPSRKPKMPLSLEKPFILVGGPPPFISALLAFLLLFISDAYTSRESCYFKKQFAYLTISSLRKPLSLPRS